MAARDLAMSLLAQNVAPSQVASSIGVSESYISQLMAEEDFAAELGKLKVQSTEADRNFDNDLDGAEAQLLSNIVKRAEFLNIQQSLVAFRILNQAQRRQDRKRQVVEQTGTVVNITLPTVVVPHYVLNGQSEIVEVEGKTMISATATQIDQTARSRNAALPSLEAMKTVDEISTLRHPTIQRARLPRKSINDLL